VRAPIPQRGADADHKNGARFAADGVLALPGRELREALLQILRVDEGDLVGEVGRFQPCEASADGPLGLPDDAVDTAHHLCEELQVALVRAQHALPIPLVDVYRVQVVEHLIGPDSVHVRVEALARTKAVSGERQPLPLGQGLHDLGTLIHGPDTEVHRLLDAGEMVVDAGAARNHHRRTDPRQVQRRGEIPLKAVLDELDPLLCFAQREAVIVPVRQDQRTVGIPWDERFAAISHGLFLGICD